MSDTPTQRFDAQPPVTPSRAPDENPRRSRLPLVLGIVGGVLTIAVIVLLVLLLGRSPSSTSATGTNSPSPTPSDAGTSTPVPTPTVTVTVSPAPSGAGSETPQKPNGSNVLITGFAISPTTVDCSTGAPSGSTNLQISWKSVNGTAAFFGIETSDAQEAGEGWTLPASGNQHDFPSGYDPFTYVCGDAVQHFTITVVGNGSKQSLTFTVRRK